MIEAPMVLRRMAFLLVVVAPLCAASAQGAVTGQVSLKERDGEQTEDLTNVIVWLEPVAAARRLVPTTATIELKARQFTPRVRAVAAPDRKLTRKQSSPIEPNSFIGLTTYWMKYFTVTRSSSTRVVREMPYFDVPNRRG